VGTGSFLGGKAAFTTHSHLAPRLVKEYSYTCTPPLGLRGLFYGELYLLVLALTHAMLVDFMVRKVPLRQYWYYSFTLTLSFH